MAGEKKRKFGMIYDKIIYKKIIPVSLSGEPPFSYRDM